MLEWIVIFSSVDFILRRIHLFSSTTPFFFAVPKYSAINTNHDANFTKSNLFFLKNNKCTWKVLCVLLGRMTVMSKYIIRMRARIVRGKTGKLFLISCFRRFPFSFLCSRTDEWKLNHYTWKNCERYFILSTNFWRQILLWEDIRFSYDLEVVVKFDWRV